MREKAPELLDTGGLERLGFPERNQQPGRQMAKAQVRVLPSARNTVMVVDDQSTGRAILEQVVRSLDERVAVEGFARPVDAVVWATRHISDLVLVDYMMPDMDGIEFVKRLRALPGYEHVPIVMVTVHDDRKVRYAALDAGITDFLTKPVDARECLARCRNLLTLRRQQLALEDRRRLLEHMVEEATREVREREKETLLRLARAGEFRDEETGYHLIRMARYSRLIADAIGLDRDDAESIELAAPLHDIGKIGIPDQILLKPGKLDEAEWQVMRRHPLIGHDILKGSASKYMRMGALIALGHHEKYDGSGYPNGLVADHIPLSARIVAVADVYDALTSLRPYKPAWPAERAFHYLAAQRGRHFDPRLTDAFLSLRKDITEIQSQWQDPGAVAASS
jgi:two-component system response regulator RpfG